MKTMLLMTTMTVLAACKTTHFEGGMARTDAPRAAPPPIETPEIPLPVASESVVLEVPVQEKPVKLETPRILTLSVSKLKHDALYKNCLSVTVDGQRHAIACNKDFTAVPPKLITLKGSSTCHAIGITLESFKPVDQADCIRRIQANPQQHTCEYQKEAFRSAVMPDPLRFKASVIEGRADAIKRLDIAFEDSQDADYNDYIFSIAAGDGTYLVNRDAGLEYCFLMSP